MISSTLSTLITLCPPPGYPVLAKSLLGRKALPSPTPTAWPPSDSGRGLGNAQRGSWQGCLDTPISSGPKPRAGSWASAHPAASGPTLPRVPSPCQCGAPRSWFRQLTNPAMQSGSLIANSFYGSWAHLCHHMQKKKKSPLKKKKFLPAPPSQTDSKRNSCQGFSGWRAKHRAGNFPGDFLQGGPGKVKGSGGAGVREPMRPDC